MKKIILIVFGIFVIAIAVVVIVRLLTPEDTWIKESNGVWVEHGNPSTIPAEVVEQQRLIQHANKKYNEVAGSNEDLSSGPCLGEIAPDWLVDIINDPRQPQDDLEQNQCADYISGKDRHYIELDIEGNLINIH